MSVQLQPSATLQQLSALLEVGRLVRDERDLEALFDRVAATISDALGFATVAINSLRPAWDDFQVVTVHAGEAARATLLGNTTTRESWQPYLAERFRRRGAYFVRHDQMDWEDPNPVWVPDIPPSDDPDAWHPDDLLIVPLERSDGEVLGFISVDEPLSGRIPTDDDLDLLVALAGHVAAAIESAQNAFLAQRHRAALARLLEVSASLVELDSVDSVLQTVADGIRDALGFEKVAVCLARGGRFAPAGTSGWPAGDPGLDFELTTADLDKIFTREFETEGCYLVDYDTASRLVGSGSNYSSQRNGTGPRAWYRHWLLVPLVERDGSVRGFVWVDDPVDCLVPSSERLQALRTFANQATMALRAAEDFATLNARNEELAALHETTAGLLERIDRDSVLTRITESACALVGVETAFLALVDEATEELRSSVKLGRLRELGSTTARRGEGVAGRVWETGRSVVVDDYARWSGRVATRDEEVFHATVGVPLLAGGRVVGVLGLAHDDPGESFGPAQVALLERFAALASLALENAHLYAALSQSEELHRQIVEHSAEIIALVDSDGRVVVASPSTERVLGRPVAEIVGTRFVELVYPDDLASAQENFAAALSGQTVATTVRALHADGRPVVLEATAVAIPGPDGLPSHVLATARDVTERHALEEQLRQAQKMESIGRLAGGIAHDFNNLLTGIRGYAELLLLDFDGGGTPSRESVEQIARAADRAASLTGQLLAFSRKQVLRPQLIDLNDVVDGMANMLSRMLGEDVVLSTALERELGRTLADPTQLEQVVLNLALNARDAMPGGGTLVIRTANLAHDDGERVVLVVADSGEGMNAETKARIFEPFFTTKPVGEGTGLGLATAHGIVAQSGGSIDVESEPGVGTTFTVSLPRAA